MTVFADAYDTATPAGSDDPAEADDNMRRIQDAVQQRENVDHYWPLTGTEVSDADTGEHRKVTLRTGSAPAAVADKGFVYAKDVGGKAELFYRDEDGNEVQITTAGKLEGANLKNDSVTKDALEGTLPDGADLEAATESGDGDRTIADKAYVDDENTSQTSGLIKAWVSFDGDTGTINGTGFNITSVSRTATGKYTITWATDFADDDYAIAGFCGDAAGLAGVVTTGTTDTPLSAGTALVETRRTDNAALFDFNLVTVIAIGDQ